MTLIYLGILMAVPHYMVNTGITITNISWEYKIIPVQPGLFYLSHGSSIYGLGEDQDFEGRCSNTNVGAVVEMNGRGDNNGDLFLSSPDEIYHEFWQMKRDKFYDFGGYCFYVKE